MTENLPFFLAARLRRPPSSVKPRPGVRRWSSRPWRVSSFHFLSLHRLGVTAQILRSSFLTVVLHPALRARDAVSFGWEDILYTAASDSDDFGAASLDVLPPSGQEARPSPAYTELVDVLARVTEKLSLDWPDGKYLTWHINGLELRAVHLALTHFLLFLMHSHVIVRMDNMAVVSHINRQGGSRSRTLNRHVWTGSFFFGHRTNFCPWKQFMSQGSWT